MIYANVKARFQNLTNAYCFLDFRDREGVSLTDWNRGLEGFHIKMLPEDSLMVFKYLTSSDGNEKVLMTHD